MSVRDDFYRVLCEDLTNKGRQSVLYRYLDEEQEQRLAREEGKAAVARSYQLRIRYYRKSFAEGRMTAEDFVKELLGLLLQQPKYGKRCRKTEKDPGSGRKLGYGSKDPEPLLCGLLHTALGKELSAGKACIARDMEKVYAILDTGTGQEYSAVTGRLREKGFYDPPFRQLMRLTDAVLDVTIAYDIREFFYGTVVETLEDYTVKKRQKKTDGNSAGARPERIDKSLKLLDYYCKMRSKSLFGAGETAGGTPSDRECDILYARLLEQKNDKVFVPLLIDRETGCGIYIIGKSYFEAEYTKNFGREQETSESCTYGVLFFDNDYGQEIKTGYHIYNGFGEFPSYNAARFSGDWSYEKARQDTADMIKELNGEMPSGIADIFGKYFAKETDWETEEYRREIKEAVAKCEKTFREKGQRLR